MYLLQDSADAAHLTVDEEAFLLAPVHLLDDAAVLHRVGHVAHGPAVTCQLLATADSMMACRMLNPAGGRGEGSSSPTRPRVTG